MTVLELLHGKLIVSVQVHAPDDPLGQPSILARIARSAVAGGAAGIRAGGISGLPAIRAIRSAVDVPVIGLWKAGDDAVYISPSVRHAVAVARAGAHIVAVDGTRRPRPSGETFRDQVAAIHAAGALVLADVASLEDGRFAVAEGADAVATTLAGYLGEPLPADAGPDLDLVATLRRAVAVPVIAEGRFAEPAQIRAAFDAGAFSVVVGRAVTSPAWLTAKFAQAIDDLTPRR